MDLARVRLGERIAGCSAFVLFILMFFHWFGVESINTSNLLFYIKSIEPGKSAWEALDCIPIVLVITILTSLVVVVLSGTGAVRRPSIWADAVVAILGLASTLLILYRIIDPPIFRVEPTITDKGTVELPIFLALLAAAGIAYGGWRAMREEGVSLPGLEAFRQQRSKSKGGQGDHAPRA